MTVDELLQQLMKIKEIYPDSGKYSIKEYNEDGLPNKDIKKIIKLRNINEIIIMLDNNHKDIVLD